jgi:sirohydrochlorin ferrochelatase
VKAILLIDHGSRRAAANEQLRALAERLERSLRQRDDDAIVEHAHMELSAPDVAAGFARCVARGATSVIAVPCMLSRGRHVTEDLPRLVREAAARSPGVEVSFAAPLAEQPSFLDVLREAAASAVALP